MEHNAVVHIENSNPYLPPSRFKVLDPVMLFTEHIIVVTDKNSVMRVFNRTDVGKVVVEGLEELTKDKD
jgi:hypothetical protein